MALKLGEVDAHCIMSALFVLGVLAAGNALCSYRKQLEISEILKSNGPGFAQFLFKFDNFTFGWCKTVKRIQEKHFLQIFVINRSSISKKHEGGG